jgi:hypothetical protein
MGLCLLVVAAAACGSPPSLPWATPPEPSGATASPGDPADPTVVPGSQPPEAVLTGFAGGPVPGDLGTSAWDGVASDSPWIVGRAAGSARAGAPLQVEFRPAIDSSEWQATWAHVVGDQLGEIGGASVMVSGPVELRAPSAAGSWSLQVFARFGAGRDAAWYWQVEVAP